MAQHSVALCRSKAPRAALREVCSRSLAELREILCKAQDGLNGRTAVIVLATPNWGMRYDGNAA